MTTHIDISALSGGAVSRPCAQDHIDAAECWRCSDAVTWWREARECAGSELWSRPATDAPSRSLGPVRQHWGRWETRTCEECGGEFETWRNGYVSQYEPKYCVKCRYEVIARKNREAWDA